MEDKASRCSLLSLVKNQGGVAIAEIIVIAGVLGVVSMGVMQLTSEIQRDRMRFTQDIEIDERMGWIKYSLRSNIGCSRTFGGAEGLQSAVDPRGSNFGAGASVTNVYDGSASARIVGTSRENDDENLYAGGTSGAFRIEDIRIWGAGPNGGSSKVSVVLERMGGEAQLGRTRTVRTIEDVRVRLGDSGRVESCRYTGEGYVDSFCRVVGSFFGGVTEADVDGFCKNIVFGNTETAYDTPPLDDESERFEMLIDGDTRLRRNLEVGYQEESYIERFENLNDLPFDGAIFIENFIHAGYGPGTTAPLELPNNRPGVASILASLHIGYDGNGVLSSPEMTAGAISNRGSTLVGFERNDFYLDELESSGEILVKNGIMIDRRNDSDSFGIDITNDSADNLPFITVGNGTFLTDPGEPNSLGLYGQGNASRAKLYLGDDEDGAQSITASDGNIGIGPQFNTGDTRPLRRIHVRGLEGAADSFGMTLDNSLRGDSYFDGEVRVYDDYIESRSIEPTFMNNNQNLSGTGWSSNIDYVVPNIGWVRRRIAQTLVPTQAEKNEVADTILGSTLFDEPESGLRAIKRSVCANTRAEGASGVNYNTGYPTHANPCIYEPIYCNEQNECVFVYANNDVIAGRDARAGRDVRADRHVVASSNVTAGNDVRAGRDAIADRDARGERHALADNDAIAEARTCVDGAGCYTRFQTRTCSPHNYVVGIQNGHIVCTHD